MTHNAPAGATDLVALQQEINEIRDRLEQVSSATPLSRRRSGLHAFVEDHPWAVVAIVAGVVAVLVLVLVVVRRR